MKKVLSVLMALTMILSMIQLGLFSTVAAASGDYAYDIINSTAKITKYNGAGGDITIPDKLGGYPVTEIGNQAFQLKSGLTKVIIPGSVITIGSSAFQSCTNLTTVKIPGSVITLKNDAFSCCMALVDLTIESGLSVIGASAFLNAYKLISVTIPESVTGIGNHAFENCKMLHEAFFLGNAPAMGTDVFASCPSAFKVYYLNNKTGFTNPWYNCNTATFVLGQPSTPILSSSITTLTLNPVTVSVTFPAEADLKEYKIGSGIWSPYTAPVLLTANVTVYARCTDAKGILSNTGFINVSNILCQENGYGYSVTDSKATIERYMGSGGNITIPDRLGGYPVKSIGHQAFYLCNTLTGVVISNNVTEIEEAAFIDCPELVSVTLPSNLITIADSVFSGCSKLINIIIPSNVTNINTDAFGFCSSLKSINIPQSVGYIDFLAFFCCAGLTDIKVDSGNINYSSKDGVLFDKAKTSLIIYPSGKSGDYAIPDGVTSIGIRAFSYSKAVTGVTIPSSLCSIGALAFLSCSALTKFVVNDANTVFASKDGVLFNKALNKILIYPAGKIGNYAIPEGITGIDNDIFRNCIGLTDVTIPNSIKRIGCSAFMSCPNLKTVTIGSGVTFIDGLAFSCCFKLTAAYFLGNAPELPEITTADEGISNAFMGCPSAFKIYYLSGKTGFTNPWYGYPTEAFTPVPVEAKTDSTTLIDPGSKLIFGLKPGTTKAQFEESLVPSGGGVSITYSTDTGGFGTGTKVTFVDNAAKGSKNAAAEALDTYTIVIFGDVNGDGNIDSIDAGTLVDHENYHTDWDTITDAALYLAGDVNGDGNVDSIDAGILVDVENHFININQTTGIAILN